MFTFGLVYNSLWNIYPKKTAHFGGPLVSDFFGVLRAKSMVASFVHLRKRGKEIISWKSNVIYSWYSYKWLFQLDDSKSLPWKNACFTKHPLKIGCLEYQANMNGVIFNSIFPTTFYFLPELNNKKMKVIPGKY